MVETVRDVLQMSNEATPDGLVNGVVAALAVFESDELIVEACYDILRECVRKGVDFTEARLVELASISFRHIASYDCGHALKLVMELVEHLVTRKTKVPAPFVLMLERLTERLKVPALGKALLLLKSFE